MTVNQRVPGSSPGSGAKPRTSAGLFLYMKFCVYLLHSESTDKYYIGRTEDMCVRLGLYNSGAFASSSTKTGIPWTIYYTIDCIIRVQALAIEKHIKQMRSVKYYQSLKLYPEIMIKLKEKYS